MVCGATTVELFKCITWGRLTTGCCQTAIIRPWTGFSIIINDTSQWINNYLAACSRLNTGLWSARLGSWQAGHLVRLQAKESMTNRTVEFIWKINNIRVHLVNPPSLSTPFTRRDGSILTPVRFAFTFERGLRPALGANFPFSPFHTRTHALAKQSHQFVVTRLSVTSANHSADGLKKIMIIISVPDGMCTHKFSLIDHKNVNKFCCTD